MKHFSFTRTRLTSAYLIGIIAIVLLSHFSYVSAAVPATNPNQIKEACQTNPDTLACDNSILTQFIRENGIQVTDVAVGRNSNGRITSISAVSKGITTFSRIFRLTKLTYVNLSSNLLSGPIPSLPSMLSVLDLADNQLTGTIPALPSTLTILMLGENHLSGRIPTSLTATKMIYLDIPNNQLSGSVPALPTTLTWLDLNRNKLVGLYPTFPSGLNTSNCDVRFNWLAGVPSPANCLWNPQDY